MATPSSVPRQRDASGDEIRTFKDGSNVETQAVVLVDPDGVQIAPFGTNDVEVASTTLTYVGKERPDGTWMVMKIDTTSGTNITYATATNNVAITTYASGWSGRAGLTYGTYGAAF